MMDFNFNKERFIAHKGHDNLTVDSLRGAHPVFIFYLKENAENTEFDVLHFDWSMQGSVRERELKDVEDDIQRYNPEWVFKHELSQETIDSTTHLMTGYYDLLKDKWIELEKKQLDKLTPKDVFDIMVNARVKSIEIFFNDKDLYLKNLEVSADKAIMPFLGHKDLEKNLNLKEIMDFIINWYKNEKTEVESNTDKETGAVMIPIGRLIEYFDMKKVPKMDSDGNPNIRNLFGIMRAYDMFQFGIYDKENKKWYDESNLHLISEDIESRQEDFIEISLLNKRFLNIFGKK